MTREEIMSAYHVVDGVIHSPGKFEMEALYAPYFSEYADDGEFLQGVDDGHFAALMEIDAEDREMFPELGTAVYVYVIENDQGFVSCALVKSEEMADKIRADYEPDYDEDEEGDEQG